MAITHQDIQAAIDQTPGDNIFLTFSLSVGYTVLLNLLEIIRPKIRFYHWWGIRMLLKAVRWYLKVCGYDVQDFDPDS